MRSSLQEEAREYEDSLKVYRDIKNSIDTAREEGREETLAQTAKKMLSKGISVEVISDITGLSHEQIEKLATDKNRVSEPAAAYKPARKTKPRCRA